MDWNSLEIFIRKNLKKLNRPFLNKDLVWDNIRADLDSSKKSRSTRGKLLTGMVVIILFSVLDVWGIWEYRDINNRNLELIDLNYSNFRTGIVEEIG